MSEAAKKRMANPEIQGKIIEALGGKKQSPETIAKRVEKLKRRQRSLPTKKNCSSCLVLAEWEKIKCSVQWNVKENGNQKIPKVIMEHIGRVEVLQKKRDFEIVLTMNSLALFSPGNGVALVDM